MSTEKPVILNGLQAAASYINLCPRKTWSLRKCNALPHKKCGGNLLFSVAELNAWIDFGCPSYPNAAEDVRKSMSEGAANERE